MGVEKIPGIPLLGRLILSLFLRNIFIDMKRMQEEIEASGLDWTIVWPPMLTDGELSGSYRTEIGKALPKGIRISRADLAHFMLQNIESTTYFKQKVTIAY